MCLSHVKHLRKSFHLFFKKSIWDKICNYLHIIGYTIDTKRGNYHSHRVTKWQNLKRQKRVCLLTNSALNYRHGPETIFCCTPCLLDFKDHMTGFKIPEY